MSAADLARKALDDVWKAIEQRHRVVIVDSPPGAGKSTLVREITRRSVKQFEIQVPIVVQTNDQADDMVEAICADDKKLKSSSLKVGRLHGSTYVLPNRLRHEPLLYSSKNLVELSNCDIIVSTAAKWGYSRKNEVWPIVVIDEAYQMRSDALLPIGPMADSLLMVGDPGQLAPFTTADDTPFRGRPMSPVEPAAKTVLSNYPGATRIVLPVSWRLPHHTANLISKAFYTQPFVSGTSPADRSMSASESVTSIGKSAKVIESVVKTGWAYLELNDLPMPSGDPELVEILADIVKKTLIAQLTVTDENGIRLLRPQDIAIGVTHKDQRDHARVAVARSCQELGYDTTAIVVETANVLQGREFELVIVWHPLSGRHDATSFHLDAGRLCVLLSRHRQGCIVVSRAGIKEKLLAHPELDPVWLGESTPSNDGWHAHLTIQDHLEKHRV